MPVRNIPDLPDVNGKIVELRPAFLSIPGRVGVPPSIIRGASPARMAARGLRHGYAPVSKLYRDGVQVAAVAYP